jgi:hypothetical protein
MSRHARSIVLLLTCSLGNVARGYLTRHRVVMMAGGGFGAPKQPSPAATTKPRAQEPPSTPQYKLTKKGDGVSTATSNHCPTLDRAWPNMRCVHHDPPVFEIDRFLPDDVCDAFIARAQTDGVMVSSRTFSADFASKRTSTTWYLPYASVPELLDPLNRLTGWAIPQFEEPQVVRYEIGQQFSWHYDAIPKSLQDASGNRLGTFIVYLNDVDGGAGATCFKDLGIQVKDVQLCVRSNNS